MLASLLGHVSDNETRTVTKQINSHSVDVVKRDVRVKSIVFSNICWNKKRSLEVTMEAAVRDTRHKQYVFKRVRWYKEKAIS